MTDQNQITSGEPTPNPVDANGKNDTVAYKTFQKVLSEKKNGDVRVAEMQVQLDGFISNQRAAEEAKLSEKGEYEKLNQLNKQRYADLEVENSRVAGERDALKGDLNDTYKLQAFYSKLNGTVKRTEYLSFVDLNAIVIDPDSGNVDETSVDNVVAKFMESHGDLVATRKVGNLPSDAPQSIAPKSFTDMSHGERSQAMQMAIAATMKHKK